MSTGSLAARRSWEGRPGGDLGDDAMSATDLMNSAGTKIRGNHSYNAVVEFQLDPSTAVS